MDAEFIDDNGGLWSVLTAEDSLESDVGAEREDRRAEQGFMAPSSAAAFLTLARTSKLEDVLASDERDPISRAYFRQLGAPAASRGRGSAPRNAAPPTPPSSAPTSPASDLLELLRESAVLPATHRANLLAGNSASEDKAAPALFTAALRQLADDAPDVHADRLHELAYLANVLAAGCSLSLRSMRPVEAARAAVATCSLGLAHALAALRRRASPALTLKRTPADKLFRIGWRILFHDVVSVAATATEKLLARETSATKLDLQQATSALRSAVAAGKPWLALRSLDVLEHHLGQPALAMLAALLDECPSLTAELSATADGASEFIATDEQVQVARRFLKHTLA